jgi:hypothetical protein
LISSPSDASWNPLAELVTFLESYAAHHPGCSKDELTRVTASQFGLKNERSVYHRPEFAIRFSAARGPAFSNTVLSLSALRKYDHTPFVVCIVRPTGIELLLANTTFLKKISHSSHRLTTDNIRGSFLGHDIARTYANLANVPANFDHLFTLHSEHTWDENLEHLVEQTHAIVATGVRFAPSREQTERILNAPGIARLLSSHPEYAQLYADLSELVERNRAAVLAAARIDNVNLRGNAIEQILSQAGNFHSVEDVSRTLTVGTEVKIDIKTKILSLSSSPKGYNIDKTLKALSDGNTVVSFFLVGVDLNDAVIATCLVSIFDRTILNATRIQFHWAGRTSRGVTQLSGDLKSLFGPAFAEEIDVRTAQAFLQMLLDLKPPGDNPPT